MAIDYRNLLQEGGFHNLPAGSANKFDRLGQVIGRGTLIDTLNRGQDVEFPTLQIPGLTGIEQQGQTILDQISKGEAFRDPSTSKFYQGLRTEYKNIEDQGVNAIRQRQNLAGGFRGSRGVAEEGRFRADIGNKLGTQLGALFEAESARDNPYTRLQAISEHGALPRLIQLAQAQAELDQFMQQTGFNYQTLPNITNILLGQSVYRQPDQDGPSDLATGAAIAGGAGSVMMGLSML